MASKRKQPLTLSDDDNEGDLDIRDETFLTIKLCSFVEGHANLWDTTHKKYRDSQLRSKLFKQFEEDNNMNYGEAQKVWRSVVAQYRRSRRNSSKSGDEAGPPKEPFIYEDELSFLHSAEKNSLSTYRSSSNITLQTPEEEDDDGLSDDSLLHEVQGTPGVKRNLSDNTKALLNSSCKWDLKDGQVQVGVTRAQRKNKKMKNKDDLDSKLDEGDKQIHALMDLLNKPDNKVTDKYADLKVKLDKTMNSIPGNMLSTASDELFMFMSSLERKYNSPFSAPTPFYPQQYHPYPPPYSHPVPPPNAHNPPVPSSVANSGSVQLFNPFPYLP